MNPFLAQVQAFAKVTGATGAATAARNCITARTGVGDYNVTLDRALDEQESLCLAVVRGADHTVYVVHTSDTVKQVLTRTLVPAAGDLDFDFIAWRTV
jgi:hypothetical protein